MSVPAEDPIGEEVLSLIVDGDPVELHLPVSGSLVLMRALEPRLIFGVSREALIRRAAEGRLRGIGFELVFEDEDLLQIRVEPWDDEWTTIDVRLVRATGERLTSDCFARDQIAALGKRIQDEQLAGLYERAARYDVQPQLVQLVEDDIREPWTAEALDRFELGFEGISFARDYNYADWLRGLGPGKLTFIPWAGLEQYLSPQCPLQPIIRARVSKDE